MKKILILMFMLLVSVAHASGGDLIEEAEIALNSFKTAKGNFEQYNNDGSVFEGEFWIKKPKKIRFDYTYPNNNFIVSNGLFIFYWDEELQQQTNAPLSYYPPAKVILDKEIKLDDSILVKNVEDFGDYFTIDLATQEDAEKGTVSLMFDRTKDSTILAQWKIEDVAGKTTIIKLKDIEFDVEIEKEKFRFKDPRRNPFKLN